MNGELNRCQTQNKNDLPEFIKEFFLYSSSKQKNVKFSEKDSNESFQSSCLSYGNDYIMKSVMFVKCNIIFERHKIGFFSSMSSTLFDYY